MSEQKRGALTDHIIKKSKELLSYEISQVELRLMPYIQYVITNEQQIERHRINNEEKLILYAWEDHDFINSDHGKITITKKFWDIICELIYLGYVDLKV